MHVDFDLGDFWLNRQILQLTKSINTVYAH